MQGRTAGPANATLSGAGSRWKVARLEAALCNVSFYQMSTTPRHFAEMIVMEMRSSENFILRGNNSEGQQKALLGYRMLYSWFQNALTYFLPASYLRLTLKKLERLLINPLTIVNQHSCGLK